MTLVQVLPEGDGWVVKLAGEQQGSVYGSQSEAEIWARSFAKEQGAEFQLHGADGEIREKDSYGNDPTDVPG